MKSPAPEGAPRIDVSCEELEALLEGRGQRWVKLATRSYKLRSALWAM